jgi:hypothetical protein
MIGTIPQSPFAFKHLSKEGHELSWASIYEGGHENPI